MFQVVARESGVQEDLELGRRQEVLYGWETTTVVDPIDSALRVGVGWVRGNPRTACGGSPIAWTDLGRVVDESDGWL